MFLPETWGSLRASVFEYKYSPSQVLLADGQWILSGIPVFVQSNE